MWFMDMWNMLNMILSTVYFSLFIKKIIKVIILVTNYENSMRYTPWLKSKKMSFLNSVIIFISLVLSFINMKKCVLSL